MKFINTITVFCGMLIFSVTAMAQVPLSLELCKIQALKHSQKVKSAEAEYQASQTQLKLSERAKLPTLDFGSSYTYLNDPNQMVVPGYELPTINGTASSVYSPGSVTNLAYNHSYKAALELSLPLYLGGKLQKAHKLSTIASEMAKYSVDLSKVDVLLRVESSYWSLVSLQEIDAELEQTIEFLNDVVKEVTDRFTTGIVTKNEVLKAQVELNNVKLARIEMQNNMALAKMSLNQAMGHNILDPIVIQDSIIIVLQQEVLFFEDEQLTNRSEIKILKNMVELQKLQKSLVGANYKPQLVSFANYISQNPNHFAKQENELTWNAGVSLSIPIFHWGEKRLKQQSQQMAIDKSEYHLEESMERLTLEIHQAIFRLKEAYLKLNFTITSLEQASENKMLETNRLMQGITTTRELLNAQSQWQKSNADFISAKVNLKICEAIYRKSVGKLMNFN